MKEMRITLIEKLTKTIEQYKSEFAKEEVTPVTSPSNARKSSMIDGNALFASFYEQSIFKSLLFIRI